MVVKIYWVGYVLEVGLEFLWILVGVYLDSVGIVWLSIGVVGDVVWKFFRLCWLWYGGVFCGGLVEFVEKVIFGVKVLKIIFVG